MIFASIGHFMLDVNDPTNTPDVGKGMIVLACFFIAYVPAPLPSSVFSPSSN
jgi:hypothetical protein